ncbi:MAG TPA: hypothetical protein VK403_12140 [Allosphingosinicella sp.]|nr:hypothetical protein [Allosphingosinicella sp.]
MDLEPAKSAISIWTGLERDALHIYAAILLQIGSAAILRRSLASPLPWLVVLVAALGNEALDMSRDGLFEEWEHGEAIHDLWNSMLMPTLLALLARFAPGLMASGRAPPPSE